MTDTKQKHNQVAIETPVVLTGYNSLSEPSKLSKDFYIDVVLDTTNPDHHSFIEELKKIHEANTSFEMDNGNGTETVKSLNLKPVTEEMKEALFSELKTDAKDLLTLRFKTRADFAPIIVSASNVKRSLKRNLPAGVEVRVKGQARSYRNNGSIGTTFYLNVVQLSPMEGEEIPEELVPNGFSKKWPTK